MAGRIRKIAMTCLMAAALVTGLIAFENVSSSNTVAKAAGAAGVQYQTHVQSYGWQGLVKDGASSGTTGLGKRLEAIKISLTNADYTGSIQYRTHVQSYGWQNWVQSGNTAGTSGEAKRLEAIQIKLTGEMANHYDVYYRVHSQTFGWLGWAKNGEMAGTAGYAKRLESIQIKLVAKGSAAPGSTANAYRHPMVQYRTHVQSIGWQNYVTDGAMSGTSGQAKRLEAINIALTNKEYTGSIQYRTHVQTNGWMNWVTDGALSGTSGQAKRLEAIQIKLTGDMANKYDVYYRVHAQSFGWLGWAKNGESAGTSGYSYRLEGIEIKLVTKGSAAPGSTANAFRQYEVKASSVSLNASAKTLNVGDTTTLTATVAPSNTANKTVTWTSSDTSVATVTSAGKVTAKASGTATITAKTSNGKTASCKITVNRAYVPQQGEDTVQTDQEAIYSKLFDINNKVTVDMNISDEQIKLMQADYKAGNDTYRMIDKMTITIGSQKYELYEVGVRIKGNTSRVDVYNGSNVNDRNLIHFKVSFKETFDDEEEYTNPKVWTDDAARKARKNRTFATLKGMEFKWNRNLDSTYITNAYTNKMYQDLGVIAQSTSLANINFGGYNYGVYTMYENVDEVFIERYFADDAKGDLYKCAWGQINGSYGGWSGATYLKNTLSSASVEEKGKDYIYELKTNKKKSTHAALTNMVNTLGTGTVSKTTYASVVDAESFVKFAAVSYFAGNPDDLRNNYNNHYVYFLNDGRAVFIPYDYDRCLGLTTSDKNMASYSPFDDTAVLSGTQQNPVFKYSIIGRTNNYTTEYKAELKKVVDSGWLNYSKYKYMYDKAKANYANVAIPSSNVKAYVYDQFTGSSTTYKPSQLAFAESNSENTPVSEYLTEIKARYNTAISK